MYVANEGVDREECKDNDPFEIMSQYEREPHRQLQEPRHGAPVT